MGQRLSARSCLSQNGVRTGFGLLRLSTAPAECCCLYCNCRLRPPIATVHCDCLLRLPIAIVHCYGRLLLPIATACCYSLLLLPTVTALCACLLLLSTATVYCYCRLFAYCLPIVCPLPPHTAIADCYCQSLLPTACQVGRELLF